MASQSYLGYSDFTVSYDVPRAAVVGSNLALTASVFVDNLTGGEDYVRDYVMTAVLVTDDRSVNASVGSPIPTQRFLYPGATWGPLNFSIPLTETDTGLSPGQTFNASLTLQLVTDVSFEYVAYKGSSYAPVFGEGGVSVLVSDPGAPQGTGGALLTPFLLLGGLAVTGAIVLLRRPWRGS